jgi:hypothetical protein
MPRESHNKAAEHHENAAKSHRTAAEHHYGDVIVTSLVQTLPRGSRSFLSWASNIAMSLS